MDENYWSNGIATGRASAPWHGHGHWDSGRFASALPTSSDLFQLSYGIPCVAVRDHAAVAQAAVNEADGDVPKTTVFLGNLPESITRSMLMDILGAQGLAEYIDFLYVPGHVKNMAHYGYAIVNLVTPEAAEACLERLHGFCGWDVPSTNICEASWYSKQQGLHANIEKYRDSRIMHKTVDDEYKPAFFCNGFRIPFPPPTMTKAVNPPRLRKNTIGSRTRM